MHSKVSKLDKDLSAVPEKMRPQKITCKECEGEFKISLKDIEFYKKMKVPMPTLCPDCRAKRRMSFYNVRTLYKRKCDKCQENILAIYDQDAKFPVYCPKCWWKDNWDASEYAMDYDFSRNFWEQFEELQNKVPRVALEIDYQRNINSPYVNDCGPLKNCYLVFLADGCENVLYSSEVDRLKYGVDCNNVSECENVYNLFNCDKCYNTFNSVKCSDCMDVNFSRNLRSCSNCFGCVNLKNKKYYIFNKKYTKEGYHEMIEKFKLNSYSNIQLIKKEVEAFFLKHPYKYMNGVRNQDVSGDNIFFSKNVKESFLVIEGENISYSQMLGMGPVRNCYDYTSWGQNAENIYENVHSGDGINNLKFVKGGWQSYDVEYSDNALFSNNLFGCVFLYKKSYCILNKQYSKEEYFQLVEKIKKQMDEMPYTDKQGRVYKYGEFFPPELSPFAYNETIAQEYFPLTKEEVLRQGCRWKDSEKREYKTTIKAKDLPDDIEDVNDSILKEIIQCKAVEDDKRAQATQSHSSETGGDVVGCVTAFKIIPQELEFYRKMNIPLPRYCPNCRHHKRLKNRNPLKLYKRTCQKEGCNTEFETTYAPDRPEIVYCEKCYNEEVV